MQPPQTLHVLSRNDLWRVTCRGPVVVACKANACALTLGNGNARHSYTRRGPARRYRRTMAWCWGSHKRLTVDQRNGSVAMGWRPGVRDPCVHLQLLHSSRTGPAVLSKLVASKWFLKAKMRCSSGKRDVVTSSTCCEDTCCLRLHHRQHERYGDSASSQRLCTPCTPVSNPVPFSAVLTCVPTQHNTQGIRTGSMEGCHWLPLCKTPLSRPR